MPNNCKYKTEDGICKLFTEAGVTSFCVDSPCPYGEAPPQTKADSIRAMSDEELAIWLDAELGDGVPINWLAWLKQEVSD